jgi:hypothetical protein
MHCCYQARMLDREESVGRRLRCTATVSQQNVLFGAVGPVTRPETLPKKLSVTRTLCRVNASCVLYMVATWEHETSALAPSVAIVARVQGPQINMGPSPTYLRLANCPTKCTRRRASGLGRNNNRLDCAELFCTIEFDQTTARYSQMQQMQLICSNSQLVCIQLVCNWSCRRRRG